MYLRLVIHDYIVQEIQLRLRLCSKCISWVWLRVCTKLYDLRGATRTGLKRARARRYIKAMQKQRVQEKLQDFVFSWVLDRKPEHLYNLPFRDSSTPHPRDPRCKRLGYSLDVLLFDTSNQI